MTRCTKTKGVSCVRKPGHKGTCTADPSAATLDWDNRNEEMLATLAEILALPVALHKP